MTETVTLAIINGVVTLLAGVIVVWRATIASRAATTAATDATVAAKQSVSATNRNRDAIKDVATRTEEVHSALNGALAAAKKLAAEQYEKALAQAIDLLKSKAEQTIFDQTAAMRTEIQMLNAKLAALTPTIVVQGVVPIMTPDPDKPPAIIAPFTA